MYNAHLETTYEHIDGVIDFLSKLDLVNRPYLIHEILRYRKLNNKILTCIADDAKFEDIFLNVSDEYGDPVISTIGDYEELSPDDEFALDYSCGNTVILRLSDDQIVAVAIEDAEVTPELAAELNEQALAYLNDHL